MSDATLRRVTPRTFSGTLHGHRVDVGQYGTDLNWHAHVMAPAPKVYTMVVLRAASLKLAAARAREWIEARVNLVGPPSA